MLLSRAASKNIDVMQDNRRGDYIFPGEKPDRPLSVMALLWSCGVRKLKM